MQIGQPVIFDDREAVVTNILNDSDFIKNICIRLKDSNQFVWVRYEHLVFETCHACNQPLPPNKM